MTAQATSRHFSPVLHRHLPDNPAHHTPWLIEAALTYAHDYDNHDLAEYTRRRLGWCQVEWDERTGTLIDLADEIGHAELVHDVPRLETAHDEYVWHLAMLAAGPGDDLTKIADCLTDPNVVSLRGRVKS